jgi:hypothetical protein
MSLLCIVLHLFYFYAECRYAECHYSECHNAECRGTFTIGYCFMSSLLMVGIGRRVPTLWCYPELIDMPLISVDAIS